MRVYLDACILIFLVEEHAEYHPRIDQAMRDRSGIEIAYTGLTRMESRIKPMRDGDAVLLNRFDRFLANPRHYLIPTSLAVFDIATELRARHNLKTPDAIHLAAAISDECDEFWTNDKRLEKAADSRITLVTFA